VITAEYYAESCGILVVISTRGRNLNDFRVILPGLLLTREWQKCWTLSCHFDGREKSYSYKYSCRSIFL